MKSFTLDTIKVVAIVCLLIAYNASEANSQERKISSDSRIERVVVFLEGAQIERRATVNVPSGNSTIEFKGLSPEIEEQSIQVKGSGNFTILSVNRQNNFLEEQKTNSEIQGLEEKAQSLRDSLELQQNKNLILQKEQEMLAANQSIGNGGAGLDLNKLRQALDFQRQRLTDIKKQQLNNQKRITALQLELTMLNKQLSDLRAKAHSNTSDIAVKVESKQGGTGNFTISYVVKNAGWYPSYDLRAGEVNKPINMVYRANVTQRSGEEWKDVKLVLSSGDPSRGGNKPELKPFQIGYNVDYSNPSAVINSVSGRVVDATDRTALPGVNIRIKGTSIGTTTDQNGYYTLQLPNPGSTLVFAFIGYEQAEQLVRSAQLNIGLRPSAATLHEVVVTASGVLRDQRKESTMAAVRSLNPEASLAQSSIPLEVEVMEGQTTVQFEVAQPYTISSDGKQLAVELASYLLDAQYKYHAVPKLTPEAFLTATVAGISDLNLMSGEANIFFEGAFLGKTLINVQNASDTLNISLGVDKNIVVKRTPQKDQNEKSFIGSNQRATRAFNYEILNRKASPVSITIEDQVPVSTSSEVSVETLELSGAKLDNATGKLIWDLSLQPNEKKELKMRYQVKFPRNRPVRLE